MKKVLILLSLLICHAASAGNGVERGRIYIPSEVKLIPEVADYIARVLVNCSSDPKTELFKVANYKLRKDRVDQGIIDEYHSFKIDQFNVAGQRINSIELEIVDAEFSNYRNYDERLYIEKISDEQKTCSYKMGGL
ncbi:MAG: hypothetical protein Fur0010_16480 [Bdellovibrio sp.]